MTIFATRLKIVGLYFTTLLCFGCGGGENVVPDELMEVTGAVTLDGESLSNASVIFTPQPGTKGNGAFGVTDNSGKYSLSHKSGKAGIEPGKYYVTFSKWAMPDGSPIPEGKTAADVEAKQVVPKKFLTVTDIGPKTVAEVKANGDTFDFDLKSK